MRTQRSDNNEASAPDSSTVQRTAQEAVQAFRTLRERLKSDTERLNSERERLASENDRIVKLESDNRRRSESIDSRLAEIKQQSNAMHQQQESVAEATMQIEREKKTLCDRAEEMDARVARLAEDEKSHGEHIRSVADREDAAASLQREVETQLKQFKARDAELKQNEKDYAERSRDLKVQHSELIEVRETVLALQDQLADDHQAVASHREQLLKKLDDAIPNRPQPVKDMPGGPKPAARSGSPKPASNNGVDQFRKLRRDAKRKVIGV